MKNQISHSMSKSAKNSSKKDAGEGEDKSSGRKQTLKGRNLKRGGGGGRDDDSVDSRGNIRNLIVDDEDEENEDEDEEDEEWDSDASDTDLTPEMRTEIRRSARKASHIARRRIQRRLQKEEAEKAARKKLRAAAAKRDAARDVSREVEDRRKPLSMKKKKSVSEEEEEAEEDEEDEDEAEEDEDEDEDEDEEDEEEDEGQFAGISINIGELTTDYAERMKPKRHNMKKESDIVKKFVALVSKPVEENTIDDQIEQFKSLSEEKQTQLITALDRKGKLGVEQNLMFKILTMNLPPDIQTMVVAKYNSLQSLDPSTGEYFKSRAWLEKLTSLPLGIYKEIPVKIGDGSDACGEFMNRAQRCLGESIYGQDEAKLQILQFIASKIANPTARGLSLLLAGPPGIGKTSLIKNGIAKALNWPFQFISLGGDSDASTYTGHQLVYESSHCGKIVNSLIAAKSMSMVLMFDEVDKISATPKGEEVGNLLIHLTDPVQNGDFEDKYLSGVPIDLSRAMFAFSGNDLNKIDKVLLDRMIVINLSGYSAKEKLAIAENFLLPQALKEVNLDEKVYISREVLQYVIEEFAKEEQGVRELKRSIEQIIQKINMLRIFNSKDLPFHIPDFHLPFIVKKEHATLFLKKKTPSLDISVQRMYL